MFRGKNRVEAPRAGTAGVCRPLLLALALLAAILGGTALAEIPESLEGLRDDFRVIELRNGWALQPRDETGDFGLIEVTEGRIEVDGQEVDAEQLRRYVDDAADLILAAAEEVEERGERGRGRREKARKVHRDTQVSFTTDLRVERDEVIDEVVLLGGELDMRGEVSGDATVVFGSATVDGRIRGSLTVVGGGVTLKPGADIGGDVVSVGGRVRRQSGSQIRGEIVQVSAGELDFGDVGIDIGDGWPRFHFWGGSGFDLVQALFGTGLMLVLVCFMYFAMPRRTRKVAERIRFEPWKSALVGLLVEVIFLPLLLLVTLLLVISIVGIPLLVVVPPLLCLVLVIFMLVGFAGISLWLGEHLADRFGLKPGPYLQLLLGLLLVYGWTILGEVLGFAPWPIRFFALLLVVFGFVAKYTAWTVGLGAAVLEQFSPLGAEDPADRWTGVPQAWSPGDEPRDEEP